MIALQKQVEPAHVPMIVLTKSTTKANGQSARGWLEETVKVIGKITRSLGKALFGGVVGFFRYLEKQSRMSAEAHNRMQTMIDERYYHNPYFIRGIH